MDALLKLNDDELNSLPMFNDVNRPNEVEPAVESEEDDVKIFDFDRAKEIAKADYEFDAPTDEEIDSLFDNVWGEAAKPIQPAPVFPQVSNVPQVPEVIENQEPRKKYKTTPYLLSTKKTLKKAGIKFYNGDDFSIARDENKSISKDHIYRAFTTVLHATIIPNALIARGAGYNVKLEDALDAMLFAMHHRKSVETVKRWEEFKASQEDTDKWVLKNVIDAFNYYILGKTREGRYIPVEKRHTLKSYVDQKLAKYRRKTKVFTPNKSPKLEMLKEAFSDDRTIADLSYKELMDSFHVSRDTVRNFKKWIEGRRESGRPDGDFLV